MACRFDLLATHLNIITKTRGRTPFLQIILNSVYVSV